MRYVLSIISAGIVFTIIHSCYYNSEEQLFGKPGNNCPDTTVFTFTGGVQPMLNKNCYSCHSNSNAASLGENIRLQDYADVKTAAATGKLLGTISHTAGYAPMPKGSAKLNSCYITVIKKWIDSGALNN